MVKQCFVFIYLFLIIGGCKKEPITSYEPKDVVENPVVFDEHPIQIRTINGEAKFYHVGNQSVFTPRGVNYFRIVSTSSGGLQDRFFQVGTFNPSQIRVDFKTLVSNGYNTVRIFLDTCGDDPGCIGNPNGSGLSPDYLKNIATTLQIAFEEGIFLLLTSNDLPDLGGYWELSNTGASDQFSGYRNAHYLTPPGIESAQLYWKDLLSGLHNVGSEFSHVLGWSILNEQWYFNNDPPFSLNSGTVTCANGKTYNLSSLDEKKSMAVEGVNYYIEKVSTTIRNWDPMGLITMGFFSPNHPNEWRVNDFKYVETEGLISETALDFYDFHAYPGEISLSRLVDNFTSQNFKFKPVIMGELGAFIDQYSEVNIALRSLQEWVASSCSHGFDGWLYWGLYRAPEAIGDATWGLFDLNNLLLKELSPLKYPDACDEALLPPENLAWNQSVEASRSLQDEPPAAAVDGNLASQWGSGEDAPQWIEIDFGQEISFSQVNLLVAQWPEGQTVHQIRGKSRMGNFTTLQEFTQNTKEGDWLIWKPTLPVNNIQYLQIRTVSSPSWVAWKEIEVFQ